jgi:multiple sugar transport system ATP-binding protein
MASIELVNLTKRFGDLIAVNDLNLEIKDKEFVALLGPSGCGKTTTMNMIAGIEQVDGGEIRFDGQDISKVPPRNRDVGFVFQNYAIFTHLSTYKNLSFALEIRKLPQDEIDRRVRDIAKLLGLENRLEVPASKLGVNEMQRLGIGRSAISNPRIFLLDEPLSNLDAAFRAVMRTELKHLQHELGQTMVYVTHDQLEAMTMADRIAVMNLGKLQQYGAPLDVYNKPRNLFVARFMGSPSMNLLYSRVVDDAGKRYIDFDESGRVEVTDEAMIKQTGLARSPDIYVGVRPEDLQLKPVAEERHGLAMTVTFVEHIGARTIVHLRSADHEVKVIEKNNYQVDVGSPVEVTMNPGTGWLFDAKSEQALEAE